MTANLYPILFSFTLVFGTTTAQANREQVASSKGSAQQKSVEETIDSFIVSQQIDNLESDQPLVRREAISAFQASLGIWKSLQDRTHLNKEQNDDANYITTNDVEEASQCDLFKQLYTVSVANRVPLLVNIANHSFQKLLQGGFVKPGSDAEACLQIGHGSCGNQAAVGLALLKSAGVQARPIEFYYTLDGKRYSHVVPEVFINQEWRIVDTTYGAYWIKTDKKQFSLATTEDVLENKKVQIFYNAALLPYGVTSHSAIYPDPFSYLKADASIVRGGKGDIAIDVSSSQGSETFTHLPNYVGDNRQDNLFEGIRIRLKTLKDKQLQVTLYTNGAAFSGGEPANIKVGNQSAEYSDNTVKYTFTVVNPDYILLESVMDVAYVVFEKLEWKYVDHPIEQSAKANSKL